MPRTRLCSILAIVACLALPATGLAAPTDRPLVDAVSRTAFGALNAQLALEQPAAPATTQTAPQVIYLAAEKPSGLSGIIASLGGWGALVGLLIVFIFQMWTGPRAAAARQAIIEAARASWYAAEVVGGSGAQKYQAACDAFLQKLGAQRVSVDAPALALRDQVFQELSSADKLARARQADAIAQVAPRPQMPLAAS